MKREIEYRGKRCSDGKWVYGFYVESKYSWKGHKPHKSWIVTSAISNGGFFNVLGRCAVKDDTVGQFTGQYDKNDKKIYEGDVVRWEYPDYDHRTGWKGTVKNVCIVTFEYGSFRINAYPYNLGSCEDFFEDKETYGLEVIGNIYDNPELLSTK